MPEIKRHRLSACCNHDVYSSRLLNLFVCLKCGNTNCITYIFEDPRDIICKCGTLMKPKIMSNIIDYHCPDSKFYNFWKHDFPKAFNRINEIRK